MTERFNRDLEDAKLDLRTEARDQLRASGLYDPSTITADNVIEMFPGWMYEYLLDTLDEEFDKANDDLDDLTYRYHACQALVREIPKDVINERTEGATA